MQTAFWIDFFGWIGALLILTAYALISLKKVEGDSLSYQLLNIFGSIFLVVNTFYWNALPSTLVNAIWLLIALFAVFSIIRKLNKKVENV